MLNALRNSTGSIAAKLFLGLLVISFAVWGIADIFTSRAHSVVATVGKTEIETTEYADAVSQYMNRVAQQSGQRLSLDDARQLGIPQVVLSQLATRAAMDEEAQAIGFSASDIAVAKSIQAMPAFQSAYGEFDRELYRSRISYMRLSEQAFEERVRKDLTRETLIQAVATGVSAPRGLVEALFRRRNETRDVIYLRLSEQDVPAIGNPSEGQIIAYHADNADQFTAPQRRNVEFVSLSIPGLIDAVEVSDEDVRAAYDERIGDYTTVPTRIVDQMPFDTEEEANEALARIKDGEAFTQIAEARGLSNRDMSLGRVESSDLPEELAEAAFAADDTGVIGPVQTAFGWTLMNIRGIADGGVTPFDLVEPGLRAEIADIRAAEMVPERAVDLEDQIAGGAPLNEAAANTGATYGILQGVDQRGLDIDGMPLADVPNIEGFLAEAFSSEVDAEPALIESDAGEYYALQVKQIIPATLRPLANVREDVIAAWKAEQLDVALKARATELEAHFAEGKTLAGVAADLGREVQNANGVGRSGGVVALSSDLRDLVFEGAKGDAVQGALSDGGYAIAMIEEINIPEAGDDRLEREVEAHAARLSDEMVRAYSQTALDMRGVASNPVAIDYILSGLGQRY